MSKLEMLRNGVKCPLFIYEELGCEELFTAEPIDLSEKSLDRGRKRSVDQ